MFLDELQDALRQKDFAYNERNRLVALLSKIFPSSLGKDAGGSLQKEWESVVYVTIPSGQCSWHIHESDLSMFSHLKYDDKVRWDGHTTEEKYRRIDSFLSNRNSSDRISTDEAIDLVNCRVTC